MEADHSVLAITDNGEYAPVNVRLVLPGTAEHERLSFGGSQPVVEFFDMTSTATVYGQRICSYTLDSLAEGSGGLNLFMSEPSWKLTAEARARAVEWAQSIVSTQ